MDKETNALIDFYDKRIKDLENKNKEKQDKLDDLEEKSKEVKQKYNLMALTTTGEVYDLAKKIHEDLIDILKVIKGEDK